MLEGLVLGLMSFVSMVFTWRNMPAWFKNWCLAHPLAAEWLSTLSAFLMLTNISSSLTAVLAATVYGLAINIAQIVYHSLWGTHVEEH